MSVRVLLRCVVLCSDCIVLCVVYTHVDVGCVTGGERARTFYFPDEEIEKASKNKMDNVAASSQAHDSHRGQYYRRPAVECL